MDTPQKRNLFLQMANNQITRKKGLSLRAMAIFYTFISWGSFAWYYQGKWKKLCYLLIIAYFFTCQAINSSAQTNDSLLVKKIVISGNELTKELVILREINFHEGEYIKLDKRFEKFNQSEKFLVNTSLFHKVSITDSVSGSDDYIRIKVKERFPAIPDFQIKSAASNINQWLVRPTLYRLTYGAFLPIKDFRGRNETLTLSAVLGGAKLLESTTKYPT